VSRRVEDLLRSGAAAARREPSPALRSRLSAALAAAPAPSAETLVATDWKSRFRSTVAAAAVLAAAGFWAVAIFGALRDPPGGLKNGTELASADPASPRAFLDLSRWTPLGLTTAVDGSLLEEIARIEEDASRAARFLVGRLPAPLAASSPQGSPR
jgi:hypothetical protein